MQLIKIIPESGEVLTHYHHMFNKTGTSCCQIKMGMMEYLGADHHMFNKTDTTCNMSMWVWCRTWVLCRGLKKGHKKERKKEWATLFKHHWKHLVRGGLIRTTTFKEQENNAVGRSTLPESSETLTHQ